DGDLFRYAASRIPAAGRAVHFLITLSTHAPFDLVDPAAHLDGATQRTRYEHSVAYLDAALGSFLRDLPKDGATLVALYGDHTSGLFDDRPEDGERAVPLVLGLLAPDGSLRPLARNGRRVSALDGVYELPALARYIKDCLDASAR
ncbi:MAG: sulfatase-like hydrolase/transferase, partial [Myxococcales bacterium]